MMEMLKLKCRCVLWKEEMASIDIYRGEVLGTFLIAPLHATDLPGSISSSSTDL